MSAQPIQWVIPDLKVSIEFVKSQSTYSDTAGSNCDEDDGIVRGIVERRMVSYDMVVL